MDNRTSKVPQSKSERISLRKDISDFVEKSEFVAPLSLEELQLALNEFLKTKNSEIVKYRDWLAVILNNEIWKNEFAKIPRASRALLLPQCLRSKTHCKASFDKFGLLCQMCGNCPIDQLQSFADNFDCLSLVSDSTSMVEKLVEEGKISAVVGVSCMASLEKSFPRILKKGIAGIAIPLLNDGCIETKVDVDWVKEAIETKIDGFFIEDSAVIKSKVANLFTRENLSKFFTLESECADEAVTYLCASGNRWRPRILVSAYFAMCKSNVMTDDVICASIAVECFHKASLIHDDIEDNDDFRDGILCLHKKIGVERAINVGDFLLGLGYYILSLCEKSKLLSAEASKANLILCAGQDMEMRILKNPDSFTLEDCLKTYSKKTSGGFLAALNMAAICASRFSELKDFIEVFSKNFGLAYQLYDDLRDELTDSKKSLQFLIRKELENSSLEDLYADYCLKTYESLKDLKDAPLKRLLFSITGLILKDV